MIAFLDGCPVCRVQSVEGLILDGQTGKTLGKFTAGSMPPAIDLNFMYVIEGSQMRALDLQGVSTAWLASSQDGFSSAPIVVDDVVFYVSQNGTLLQALQASTGNVIRTTQLGSAIEPHPVATPVYGMAAGHGLLAVPAGNTLSVFRLHD